MYWLLRALSGGARERGTTELLRYGCFEVNSRMTPRYKAALNDQTDGVPHRPLSTRFLDDIVQLCRRD